MFIDPRHLEQLAAIIDQGTLNEAAKQIGTSQPALSRMLNTLEGRIGVSLFERNSRPLVPTETGLRLAEQGRAIKAARERAVEDVIYGLRGISGELKIGAPPFLCERLVGEAISKFFNARPEIRIDLVADYFPSLEARMLVNQIDVMICPTKFVVATKTELKVEPLFLDQHVIVARQGHYLANKKSVTASDLESVTWIGHSERSMLRADMATALASIGVANLRFGFQSESAGSVIEMLRNTDFLTVLPKYVTSRPESDSGLAILPVSFASPVQTIGLITPNRRAESPLLAAFKTHMREYVATQTL